MRYHRRRYPGRCIISPYLLFQDEQVATRVNESFSHFRDAPNAGDPNGGIALRREFAIRLVRSVVDKRLLHCEVSGNYRHDYSDANGEERPTCRLETIPSKPDLGTRQPLDDLPQVADCVMELKDGLRLFQFYVVARPWGEKTSELD